MRLSYKIDDVDLDRKLRNFPENVIPYSPIHRTLEPSLKRIREIFNDSSEVPFSRAYEARVGECLEKAILVQLSAQKFREAFLINGCLVRNNAEPLAYNIIFNRCIKSLS